MSINFLGNGLHFPIDHNGQGQFRMARHEESVRQAIWMILSTSPGERVMRPDFGCGLHNLVFGVNNAATAGQVAAVVQEALALWEPRIDVLDISAWADPEQANRLLIEINYRVRSTNSRFNLVYPFYLE